MQRSIERAINKETGEIVHADTIFKTQKEGQSVYKEDKFNEGDDFLCFECAQFLETSTYKKNVFFRHKKGHEPCIYTNGSLSEGDREYFHFIAKIKEESQDTFKGKRSVEGARHKYLKSIISSKIKKEEGVIYVQEEKVLNLNGKVRRPDVYCKYLDKELVFEIQLSKLSARYMFARYKFYKENGIYLIWILDVEIDSQDQFAINIKYLNKYENFYRLNEKSQPFRLSCLYKEARINFQNEVYTKWIKRSLSLSQLEYDKKEVQVYFYNLELKLEEKRIERRKRLEEAERLEQERLLDEKRQKEAEKRNWINSRIEWFKKSFRELPNENAITNSAGETLYFVQPEFPIEQIRSLETMFPKVKWFINATEISYEFDMNPLLQEKLEAFSDEELSYYKNVKALKDKIKEHEDTLNSKKKSIIDKIEGLNLEIETYQRKFLNKYQSAQDYLDLLRKRNALRRNDEFEVILIDEFEIKIRERQDLIGKLEEEIIELQAKIKLWQDSKGRLFKGKILQTKMRTEINIDHFKKNLDKIVFIERIKWDTNSPELLKSLKDYNVVDILANKEDYSFLHDYSVEIDQWENTIRSKREKVIQLEDSWGNERFLIQRRFEVWIKKQIKVIDKSIKELEIESSNLDFEFIETNKDTLTAIEDLEIRLAEKRKKLIKKFENRYNFYWRDFDLEWEHAKNPIFFDTGNEILFMFAPDCVGKYQYDEFISRFNK